MSGCKGQAQARASLHPGNTRSTSCSESRDIRRAWPRTMGAIATRFKLRPPSMSQAGPRTGTVLTSLRSSRRRTALPICGRPPTWPGCTSSNRSRRRTAALGSGSLPTLRSTSRRWSSQECSSAATNLKVAMRVWSYRVRSLPSTPSSSSRPSPRKEPPLTKLKRWRKLRHCWRQSSTQMVLKACPSAETIRSTWPITEIVCSLPSHIVLCTSPIRVIQRPAEKLFQLEPSLISHRAIETPVAGNKMPVSWLKTSTME